MVILIVVICVVAMLYLHADLTDSGVSLRSRQSLRYQRRKARRMGIDPADVVVQPRHPHQLPEPKGSSHVADLNFGFLSIIVVLLLFLGGFSLIRLSGISDNWGGLWLLLLFAGVDYLNKRRRIG